jgi:hypothetical protein
MIFLRYMGNEKGHLALVHLKVSMFKWCNLRELQHKVPGGVTVGEVTWRISKRPVTEHYEHNRELCNAQDSMGLPKSSYCQPVK